MGNEYLERLKGIEITCGYGWYGLVLPVIERFKEHEEKYGYVEGFDPETNTVADRLSAVDITFNFFDCPFGYIERLVYVILRVGVRDEQSLKL